MDTSFIATNVRRLARKRMIPYAFFFMAIPISACSFLGILWLIQLRDAGFYITVIAVTIIVCAVLIRSVILLNRAIQNPLESYFVTELKRFGPLPQTIMQIDSESALYIGKIGSFVTQHWIISTRQVIIESSLSGVTTQAVLYVVRDDKTFWLINYSTGLEEFQVRLPVFEQSANTFSVQP